MSSQTFRYLIWIVKGTEKKFVPEEDIELPKDWPKEALRIVTRYHMLNPNKQYTIPRKLYEKVYELENMRTRSHAKAWDNFLDVLASGNETEAILLRRNTTTTPLIRVLLNKK